MVRRELVAAKAGRARVWLNDAATTLLGPLDTFQADARSRDLSLFYLFLAMHCTPQLSRRRDDGRRLVVVLNLSTFPLN